mmetsp:Transcript_9820/g.22532  ORF Transcript_9820/g.22532 Transcript_9820/m.22532 type:complete len:248 (-) Transcript_9820:1167-1910(-)
MVEARLQQPMTLRLRAAVIPAAGPGTACGAVCTQSAGPRPQQVFGEGSMPMICSRRWIWARAGSVAGCRGVRQRGSRLVGRSAGITHVRLRLQRSGRQRPDRKLECGRQRRLMEGRGRDGAGTQPGSLGGGASHWGGVQHVSLDAGRHRRDSATMVVFPHSALQSTLQCGPGSPPRRGPHMMSSWIWFPLHGCLFASSLRPPQGLRICQQKCQPWHIGKSCQPTLSPHTHLTAQALDPAGRGPTEHV